MVALFLPFASDADAPTAPRARAMPQPPKPGPVLIGDCATPVDHGTLLLALWRRWDDPGPRDDL